MRAVRPLLSASIAVRTGAALWIWLCAGLAAAAPPPAEWQRTAEQRLPALEKTVSDWQQGELPPAERVAAVYQEAVELRNRAEACETELAPALAGVKTKLEALGEATGDETPEIARARRELEDERKRIERDLGVCRLLKLGAKGLLDRIQVVRQQVLSQALLSRGVPTWEVLPALIGAMPLEAPRRLLRFDWVRFAGVGGIALLVLLPAAVGVRRWLRRRFALEPPPAPAEDTDQPASESPDSLPRHLVLARMYGKRAMWLAPAGAVALGLVSAGATPLAYPVIALMVALLLAPLLQLLVCQAEWRCTEGTPARVLQGLALIAAAAMLGRVELYLAEELYLSLRGLFLILLALNAWWLLFALSRRENWPTLRSVRLPLAAGLISGPAAEWLGYRALADLLTLGIYGTVVGALIAWLLWEATGGTLRLVQDPQSNTGRRVRQLLGSPPEAELRGLGVARAAIAAALLVGYGYWLLGVWQASPADTAALRDLWSSGFQVGAINIVPSRLVSALVALVILVAIARWLKRQLDERWLTRTKLDAGARQSIVSLTGYVIVGAAILLALSMAGLEFQNLAIIAGALSVGIGFGLQNIVNNFVSGLILLFERPVRPGDWIVVGSTEGYVKKVAIRYTQIRTFDRADVLVPNSELISNQVTNWMLNDPFGRVIVPVGVAYGSDTRKVRDILLKAAKEHPLVMSNDPRVPTPTVFFTGFGDSSLNFDLRCMIQQVDYRLSVRSDLLFAIDDAFREAGIEIPFPQRVVHMPVSDPAPPAEPQQPAGDGP